MTPSRDLHEALKENFKTIWNTTCPQERQALIDSIWEYVETLARVRKAMMEQEVIA